MKDLIKNIIEGNDIDQIFNSILYNLYKEGPISVSDMEILSYLSIYHKEKFEEYKDSILNYMAIFYKNTEKNTLKDVVFGQYKKYLLKRYSHHYTPVQANIVKEIIENKCFSFSASTSTGKSHVFMNIIIECVHDVVVIVPSRALINEYYLKLCTEIQDKSINILTFIDKINTENSRKNIFIVTPERCRDLFKQKQEFTIDLFLFDEAQLSDEDSRRGLYFDSIVRRCQFTFPNAKFVFAHPYVQNPESQIQKNHFDFNFSKSRQYMQKNVGQIFLCIDENWKYYHFGIDTVIMGKQKVPCSFDPIEKAINGDGSVLFYIAKAKIFSREFMERYGRYIEMCTEIENEEIDPYIEKLKLYTGGDIIVNKDYYSQMIAMLKRGIVIHHGSLPLQTRMIIEEFTRHGLCKLCFATSTLDQGINMPFDAVVLDRLEAKKPLAVKNLIGRAGRSTSENKFDYGFVIINSPSKVSIFRKIINQDIILNNVSSLESDEEHDDDYNEFKEAILNGTFSDEYNLTKRELEVLRSDSVKKNIALILDSTFRNNKILELNEINKDEHCRLELYSRFSCLYSIYLGRSLEDGEKDVLNTAIKIILWRIHGKTFKNICWYRYSYVSKTHERQRLDRLGISSAYVEANYMTGYHDIPDKDLKRYPIFKRGTRARDVDYDLIVYDTYDYIDKLIGFKLSDIYYAAFFKYHEDNGDERALKLARYIKYGTDNERYIWMLRYGMSFEDIEMLDNHIQSINAKKIVFKDSIHHVADEYKQNIVRFLD